MAPNGALSVTSSTITGAVTLKSGYTTFDFCGSKTIRGAISATGAKGSVLIGGLLCSSNTIDGAVTLDANNAGDVVAGAVTASANLNGTTISGSGLSASLPQTQAAHGQAASGTFSIL